ncbi:hypothetical protein BGZ94_009646 [Podila epigama]|nr:hypothetical protein BGZ94_009646 [Podila epigama]
MAMYPGHPFQPPQPQYPPLSQQNQYHEYHEYYQHHNPQHNHNHNLLQEQQQQQQQTAHYHHHNHHPHLVNQSITTVNHTFQTDTMSSTSSLPPGLTHSFHPTHSDMEMNSNFMPHPSHAQHTFQHEDNSNQIQANYIALFPHNHPSATTRPQVGISGAEHLERQRQYQRMLQQEQQQPDQDDQDAHLRNSPYLQLGAQLQQQQHQQQRRPIQDTYQPHNNQNDTASPPSPANNGQLMTPTSGYPMRETEMPSLDYSEGNSSSSKAMDQSPRMAHPSPSLSISPQNVNGGPDVDGDYFLMSVLNMIASTGVPPVQHFDYPAEFTQRQRIAKGGNGEIRRAFWSQRQCFVILKSLIDTKHTPEKIAKMFDKEVEVMNRCRGHSNIVQFYGVAVRKCDDERNGERFMIMHFYEHGDLVKLLEAPQHQPDAPTLTDRLYLALDIALGLDHLFKCGFHHGDLHPKNVLIDIRRFRAPHEGRYQARLTDFGLRRIRDSKNAFSSQQFGGVWQFMAPERMAKTRPRYDVRCDIFALGMIYWQLMSGRYPFKDPSTFTPRAREARVEGTPNWYHSVYTQAWSEDPNDRQQSLEEIIQVFRFNLGIQDPPMANLDPNTAYAQYPSPVIGYDSMRAAPYASFDGHGPPSPMMLSPLPYPTPAPRLPPSPLLTNSSMGSMGQRATNPNDLP